MDIEAMITVGSYFAIFFLMIANGAASFPSSQILYIVTGYFISTGSLGWFPAVLAGASGNTIGNIILYEAVRRYGRGVVTRYRIFDERMLAKVEIAVREKGWWFLFIGKLLPAIKVFVPVPAGLGNMHRGGFAFIMALASIIWANIFLTLGYVFGKGFHIFGWYGLAISAIAIVLVFFFYRYVSSISPTHLPKNDESRHVEKK